MSASVAVFPSDDMLNCPPSIVTVSAEMVILFGVIVILLLSFNRVMLSPTVADMSPFLITTSSSDTSKAIVPSTFLTVALSKL